MSAPCLDGATRASHAVEMAIRKPRSELADTLIFLAKLALFALIFRSFLIAPYNIPSESMLPRLYVGDYLIVSKWNYGYSRWSLPWGLPPVHGSAFRRVPSRGDVIVFRAPVVEDHDVVKRVIGLPGDTVEVRRGTLYLNGAAVPKQRIADFVLPLTPNFDETHCAPPFRSVGAGGIPVCRYPRYRETLPGGATYAVLDQGEFPDRDETSLYTVPAGHLFVMGDNRDDSGDSRFPAPPNREAEGLAGYGMGYVPLANVEGKALVTFFSTDGTASWVKPWTWGTATRWRRVGEGF